MGRGRSSKRTTSTTRIKGVVLRPGRGAMVSPDSVLAFTYAQASSMLTGALKP